MPTTPIVYTDSDTVRALAGLTANELTDPALLSMQLDLALEVDLARWLAGHADIQAAGQATGADASAKLRWQLLQLYSSHFCAAKVLQSSLHIPLQKGNGKDTAKRFDESVLERSMLDLSKARDQYRDQLLELVAPTTAAPDSGMFRRVTPATDPVIGE